ncbi:DUF2017 family protein [Nesterenkonia sp. MY13]|uniref:DUF2017 family protein n=1 Tax=Nesterenkonia sedimenti TaxID=1463632 RepID=A0A7X8TKV9_9MICC|nr:DUF2017 family protein [Nesterenkonia sedimenti]NLS10548.1 DUF2017 family protein [Nesterenkonia sedimenti]
MARAFRATTRGYKADLETHERRLISQLCADVITLLQQRGKEVDGDTAATDQQDEFDHFRRELAGLGAQYLENEQEQAENDDDAQPGLEPPTDEVLARLLPDAAEDADEAAQLRRLSESSLRESKISDLQTARMALESDPVILTEEQAPVFGRAINDVRLTLAARLGIETEDDAEKVHNIAGQGKAATTDEFMAELYAFTTWLQETLFSAMLDVMPEEQDR